MLLIVKCNNNVSCNVVFSFVCQHALDERRQAERQYLAILKQWWCAVIARLFYASQLVVELDSPKVALSGKRVTNSRSLRLEDEF